MIFTWLKSGTRASVLLYALLVAVHMFFALDVYANTVWNPAGNSIYSPDVGNWSDAANWQSGLPGFGPNHDPNDGLDPKAVFNVFNAVECQVTDSQSCLDLVMGEYGPGGVLRIVGGGTLTAEGGWMSIGYNDTATLIVEEGGVCNFAGHLWWGMGDGADAIIEINGGTITGGRDFGLGWHDNAPSSGVATAKVYVNAGEFNIHHWVKPAAAPVTAADWGSIQEGSFIDIELGYVTIIGDQTDAVSGYVAAGRITAYGGIGRVLYDYNVTNPGKTTIRAIDVIENPSFELFEYHPDPNFSEALYWEIENYAADANSLVPKIEFIGEGMGGIDWPNNLALGLPPKDGERLLMLSTGHIGKPMTTNYGKAWQHIAVQEGDRLSGYYFFGTCDYHASFNDYAEISLINNADPNGNIPLAYKSVADVGDHSSMAGWERFEHRITSGEAGRYDLTFFVTDVDDRKVNSYLGIDDLQLCAAPAYGDINYDCQTNNLDFAVISYNWLIDCEDPEMSDPNYCPIWTDELGSPGDLNGNNKVDIEDIKLMLAGWLGGEHP